MLCWPVSKHVVSQHFNNASVHVIFLQSDSNDYTPQFLKDGGFHEYLSYVMIRLLHCPVAPWDNSHGMAQQGNASYCEPTLILITLALRCSHRKFPITSL